MTKPRRSLPCLALLAAVWFASGLGRLGAAETAPSTADQILQAYETVTYAPPPKPANELPRAELFAWAETRALRLRELTLAFIDKYPGDPRRWQLVVRLAPASPRFVREWGALDDKGEPSHPVVDEPAAAAWKARVAALRAALVVATDVPPEVRDQFCTQEALLPFTTAVAAQRKNEPVDLADLRAQLKDFAGKNPGASGGRTLLYYYSQLVEALAPATLQEELAGLADSPNASIAEMARAKVRFYELARNPLALAFTAVDGRVVDLAALRGKVVLIDFWATWCGPCIAELPRVKKVYAAYRDQGFEVIGIALENAKLTPADTPEIVAAKLARAKKILTDFTAKEQMPWPQYFDGKYWKNDLSTQYAISSIPAMFLLDRTGRIVSTNARGPALEAEVKRLLGSAGGAKPER